MIEVNVRYKCPECDEQIIVELEDAFLVCNDCSPKITEDNIKEIMNELANDSHVWMDQGQDEFKTESEMFSFSMGIRYGIQHSLFILHELLHEEEGAEFFEKLANRMPIMKIKEDIKKEISNE